MGEALLVRRGGSGGTVESRALTIAPDIAGSDTTTIYALEAGATVLNYHLCFNSNYKIADYDLEFAIVTIPKGTSSYYGHAILTRGETITIETATNVYMDLWIDETSASGYYRLAIQFRNESTGQSSYARYASATTAIFAKK